MHKQGKGVAVTWVVSNTVAGHKQKQSVLSALLSLNWVLQPARGAALLKTVPMILSQQNWDTTKIWEGLRNQDDCKTQQVLSVCLSQSSERAFLWKYREKGRILNIWVESGCGFVWLKNVLFAVQERAEVGKDSGN